VGGGSSSGREEVPDLQEYIEEPKTVFADFSERDMTMEDTEMDEA